MIVDVIDCALICAIKCMTCILDGVSKAYILEKTSSVSYIIMQRTIELSWV